MRIKEKVPFYCQHCGAEIPRFEKDDRVQTGCIVTAQERHPRLHHGRTCDWYDQAQSVIKSWKLCDSCCREAVELIDKFASRSYS